VRPEWHSDINGSASFSDRSAAPAVSGSDADQANLGFNSMKLQSALYFVAACAMFATSALADSSYVRRPKGWFVLVPPLTKPDPVTGARYVDAVASQRRWYAMIIPGSDGHNYDFADEKLCNAWKDSTGMKLSKLHNTLPLRWLGRSKCAKDDNRRSVITYERWTAMMKRYQGH